LVFRLDTELGKDIGFKSALDFQIHGFQLEKDPLHLGAVRKVANVDAAKHLLCSGRAWVGAILALEPRWPAAVARAIFSQTKSAHAGFKNIIHLPTVHPCCTAVARRESMHAFFFAAGIFPPLSMIVFNSFKTGT
jgi:hypothetical protein